MVKKEGKIKNIRHHIKNNLLSLVIFIAILSIGVVIAGNITFKEGDLTFDGNIIGNGSQLVGIIPYGALMPFALSECPSGWVLANGSDGTPDLRGTFIRASGTSGTMKYANGSYVTGGSQGDYMNDSTQGHWHNLQGTSGNVAGSDYATGLSQSAYPAGWGAASTKKAVETTNPVTDETNGAPRTGAETRPVSYSTIYCMKT